MGIKKIEKLYLICFSVLFFGSNNLAIAKVKLPALVSDGMVLQREQKLPIWGWADAGEQVTVHFRDQKFSTVTGNDGKWKIVLPAQHAGGPYQMKVSGTNEIVLNNILIGEVWLCSGQSNMEFQMGKATKLYANEIARAGDFPVRQFEVKKSWAFAPQNDVTGYKWTEANPKSILYFTAVGYFFALELYEKYKVPIGLINASFGGTPVESWTSEDGLKDFPQIINSIQVFKDPAAVKRVQDQNASIASTWYHNVNKGDLGSGPAPWFGENTPGAQWKVIDLPGFYEDQGVNVDGVIWLKKEVHISKSNTAKSAILELGIIIDEDSTYINGQKVGATGNKYNERRYNVPANLLKEGINTITIRTINKEKQGGLMKDKSYRLLFDGDTLSLVGKWKLAIGVSVEPLQQSSIKEFSREPTVLFNSMVAPLVPYAIKGILWYQGENNVSAANRYQELFTAFINDWRVKWANPTLPVIYTQLANFLPSRTKPAESSWAQLRDAQAKTLSVKQTGMAVIHDLGEANEIHPMNKKDVGKRLAKSAFKVAYQEKQLVYSGPVYQKAIVHGSQIVLSFTQVGSGLELRGQGQGFFAIAGADKKFVWADAKIEGENVIIQSSEVVSPLYVRYAWADNPQGSALYNKEGLPASVFRTDQ